MSRNSLYPPWVGSGELAHGSTPDLVLRSFYPTDSSDFHQRSLELSQNSSRTRLRRYENHSGPWKTILLKGDQNRSDLVRFRSCLVSDWDFEVNCECKLGHKSWSVCVGSTPWFSAASDLSESTQLAQFIPNLARCPDLDGNSCSTICLISNPKFSPKSTKSTQKVKGGQNRDLALHWTSQRILNWLSLFPNSPDL